MRHLISLLIIKYITLNELWRKIHFATVKYCLHNFFFVFLIEIKRSVNKMEMTFERDQIRKGNGCDTQFLFASSTIFRFAMRSLRFFFFFISNKGDKNTHKVFWEAAACFLSLLRLWLKVNNFGNWFLLDKKRRPAKWCSVDDTRHSLMFYLIFFYSTLKITTPKVTRSLEAG